MVFFCICENKGADQLRGNRVANQHALFRYIDRKIPLQPKSEFQASNHLLWLYSPVYVEKPEDMFLSRCGLYNVLFKQPIFPVFSLLSITGDSRGHTVSC